MKDELSSLTLKDAKLTQLSYGEFNKELVRLARVWLEKASNEQRLEMFSDMSQGYCKHCGRLEGIRCCQCWNDE